MDMISGKDGIRSVTGKYSSITYRNQLLDYNIKDLPFTELMDNFKDTFERVYVEEKPNTADRYYLSNINMIQIATTRLYDTLFSFQFTKHTSREVNYASSLLLEKVVKRILRHIGRLENFQTDNQNDPSGPSVKIQMYEFFFSNILIKAMQIPFLDNSYMIGFFERNMKKRQNIENRYRNKKKMMKKREYEDARRGRTMKLRQFYEFFALLFDQKLFSPFSQFLSENSLKELKLNLTKRIKVRDFGNKRDSSIEDLKIGQRARSTAGHVITPLAYAPTKVRPLIHEENHDVQTEEGDEEISDYKPNETSRFGIHPKASKTIDQDHKPVGMFKTQTEKQNITKKEFLDFTDDNIKNIVGGDMAIDDTLSLSNITKEINVRNKHVVKNNKKMLDFDNSISQIDARKDSKYRQDMSHSYDIFTNSNITPIKDYHDKSSYSNNRYLLRQNISKSEVSASLMINPNRDSLISKDGSFRNFKNADKTPHPLNSYGLDYPLEGESSKPIKKMRRAQDVSFERVSKSHSELSVRNKSSISRIFQPSPDRMPPLNNRLDEL